MKSRLLAQGILGCVLPIIGVAPMALRAANPPGLMASADPAASPDESGNPYAVIVERNIFRLNPIPPPPEIKPKLDLPVVKITGFINIGDQHKVLFVSQPKNQKDAPAYYSLSEGEKSGDGKFELVKIHPGLDAVDALNDGVPVTLTVKDDSLAPGSAPEPAAAKEAPPAFHPGGGMAGRPMFNRSHDGMPSGMNGFTLPTRARRTPP